MADMKCCWLLPYLFILGLFSSGCDNDAHDTTGYEVSLHNTPEGTLYTIRDPRGKILTEEITAEKLATLFPQIHHEVRDLESVNLIEIHSSPGSAPINEPEEREVFWGELPPPTLEETLIDLPPLPELRTEDKKTRREKLHDDEIRETTNQLDK
jgi:hypothetical protein